MPSNSFLESEFQIAIVNILSFISGHKIFLKKLGNILLGTYTHRERDGETDRE